MKKITKTYKKLKIDGTEHEVDGIICYGFDQEFLTQHPSYFQPGEKEVYLYMFIPFASQKQNWFKEHKNENDYIYVAFTGLEVNDFELLVKIVDKIHQQQREAVEKFTSEWEIKKKDS